MPGQPHRLTRSETDRMLLGVCGGLGEYFGIDSTLVRVVFVLLSLFGASGLVLYLVLWLIVPRATRADATPRETVTDSVGEGWGLAREGAQAARRGYERLRGGAGAAGGPPDTPGPGDAEGGGDDRGGGAAPR